MSLSADLLAKIQQQIDSVDLSEDFSKKGSIVEIKDGVATVSGLSTVSFSEIVTFENGVRGLVLDLMEEYVGVLVLGDYSSLNQGGVVTGTGTVYTVPVGEALLGRVLDGLGNPIDGEVLPADLEQFPVERIAAGVIPRQGVDQPMLTGIKAIDAMIPIGRGQRELIIGDRQTGKTAVAIDTILNQADQNMKCVYVAIGQKESKVRRTVETLRAAGALEYTTIISAGASDPSVMQYLAPYVGCAIAEYYMYKGEDALIVYDDLSKHAVAYREVSLLLRRPPGREAYPGDVFYLHSKLLERAARLNAEYIEEVTGGKVKGKTGSLTALPIIETQGGDVSGYIPTNVISITDGQIFLQTDLFNSGMRPAIDVGNSVSRVGGSAQYKITKKVSGKLKLGLAAYREMQAFSQFASDLDPETQKILSRGERMYEMLKQGVNSPIPFHKQAVLTYAGIKNYFDTLEVDQVRPFEEALYDKLDTTHKELSEKIIADKKLTDEIEEGIKTVIKETVAEFAS